MESNRPNIKRLKYLLFLFALAVVLAGIFWLVRNSQSKDYIFSVDGQSYSQAEVDKITGFPTKLQYIQRETAAQQAFEGLKKIAAAKQTGIELDQKEIDSQKKILWQEAGISEKIGKKYAVWFDIFAKASLIDKMFSSDKPLGYKGYSFYFYFGQHIQYGPDYEPAGLNNPQLIKADRDYAQRKAEEYNQKIKDNQVSPGELLKILKRDKRFGPFGYNSLKFGYDPNRPWYQQGLDEPIIDTILSQKTTGTSVVKVGKAIAGANMPNAEPVDTFYYFVVLDSVPKGYAKADFDHQLQEVDAKFIGYGDDSNR